MINEHLMPMAQHLIRSPTQSHRILGGKWTLSVSTIKIQRKYILIARHLGIGEVGEMIQHSSKVTTSLSSTLPVSYLLLQTLTLAYWLLDVTQPGLFGDCWFCVPPGASSQLPLTASPIALPHLSPAAPVQCCHDSLPLSYHSRCHGKLL